MARRPAESPRLAPSRGGVRADGQQSVRESGLAEVPDSFQPLADVLVGHEAAMPRRSTVARVMTMRSSTLRACSRWSSQALRCARAARLGRPLPLRSHGPHTYAFQLFALDQAPGLPAGFTLDDVIAASKGHAIGRARLDGTYEIR
jgi:phosphatidylethanolamine-binding protein (PEBP) family uncharacterized protein